jgi:putative methionine-R-sulfoxide reductase with GAF domain
MGWWLVAGAVWMVGASAGKVLHARAQDRERKRAGDYEGLHAALQVLFAAVCATARVGRQEQATGRLRATIHRVVPNGKHPPEELEQLLPYVGGPGDLPGRRFSIRSGIIGKAARRRSAVVAARGNADHEGFIAELVHEWAYTDHDARKLTPDRHAWMAVPILNSDGAPVAVVYLDSRDPDFFSEAAQPRILTACDGIRTYTVEAYP